MLGIWLIVILVSGCGAPRVNLGLTKGQENTIKFDRAGGNMKPEQGLNLLSQQAGIKTQILLQAKLRAAIEEGSQDKIKEMLGIIEALNGNGALPLRTSVKMRNSSSYSFQVTTGEFKGLTLGQGDTSLYAKNIPLGLYSFNVKFVDNNGKLKEWTVSRIITSSTKYIELKNIRR